MRLVEGSKKSVTCPVTKEADTRPAAGCSPKSNSTTRRDQITFGMKVSIDASCCLNKLKTGAMDCCKTSPEKHVEQFRNALKEKHETTGVKPMLDPHAQAIVDGKLKPGEPFISATNTKTPESKKLAKRRNEPLIKKIVYAPFRFIKWFWTGFWKDLQQLFSRKTQ